MRCLLMIFCLGLAAGPCATARAEAPAAAVEVELQADLGHVSLRQLELIRTLIRAAQIMDELYQQQVAPGGFYPADMGRSEFEAWADPAAASPYTRVRRDVYGRLEAVPYHEAWPVALGRAARLLARAAEVTTDETLRHYLTLRARALITGDHARADAAWRAMRHSEVEVLIGPIGLDADPEFGLKAGFGAYVLLRDWAWGARLARFTVFLPKMQHDLPVSGAFKSEVPDVELKLGVYDLLYQAGSGAARAVPVGPEKAGDPRVRLENGPRRLQLRNVMHARFEKLVRPAAETLIVPEQRAAASFETFFLNTMLHEMAHSLGMSRTIGGRATVSAALREHADTMEETKAAVLSLWIVDWLHEQGELPETTRMAHYVSFLAAVLRAIQLDAHSPSGQARLLLFNYFRDWGAFRRDPESGLYRVEEADMGRAIEALAAHVLTIQGSGDHAGAAALIETMAVMRHGLREDLDRLAAAGIPANLVFRHDERLLGL
jgi:hypothetical protein